ncbi:hypothetical protein [Sulfitobacter faviae]|uniref:hypothetical protein n=1 Tax=Sulfitobacter faviae TaxID=1775881 RepID=UPI00398D465A
MTNNTEPADLLLHDLRRFLHNAVDQQATLDTISKAMAGSASSMKEQERTAKRILQGIQKQIDGGVAVRIDADLKAHIASVSRVTAPLATDLQKATNAARRFATIFVAIAFSAGFAGGMLGVFAALRLV